MIKILYLPLGDQPATELAFKNITSEVKVFDFWSDFNSHKNINITNNKFYEIAVEFKPDFIHMQLQFTGVILPETLINIRNKLNNVIITNWTGDIRKELQEYLIRISKVIDYSLMSNVGQIELYSSNGCKNPTYWQIGYDDSRFYPLKYDLFEYDLSFIANSYDQRMFPDVRLRQDTAISLKQKYGSRFGLYGNGWPRNMARPVPMIQTNDIYNKSVAVLSISNFNDVSHYFSDRLLMCMASGRPTISWRFPGSSSYFKHEENIIFVSSLEEIYFWVEKFKREPELANYIGNNGYLTVKNEHTMNSRVIELMYITGLWSKI